ncbi:hypothetical protein Y887_09785 [Xanthomonas pisi DSM 18956]|nr:hypothetical protein Y887_09785 [Xanthomonas pisi DSM 18956]
MRGANDSRTVRMKVKTMDAATEAAVQRPACCRRCSCVVERPGRCKRLPLRQDNPATGFDTAREPCMRIDQ